MPEISRNRQNARYAEDVVNVKDFGAVGDGVTDDTSNISTAISAASSAGAYLHFPAGTYIFDGTLSFNKVSSDDATLKLKNSASVSGGLRDNLITFNTAAELKGRLTIDCNATGNAGAAPTNPTYPGVGVLLQGGGHDIDHLKVIDSWSAAINDVLGNMGDIGDSKIGTLEADNCGSGIFLECDNKPVFIDRIIVTNTNTTYTNSVSHAVDVFHAKGGYINSIYIDGCDGTSASTSIWFSGLTTKGNYELSIHKIIVKNMVDNNPSQLVPLAWSNLSSVNCLFENVHVEKFSENRLIEFTGAQGCTLRKVSLIADFNESYTSGAVPANTNGIILTNSTVDNFNNGRDHGASTDNVIEDVFMENMGYGIRDGGYRNTFRNCRSYGHLTHGYLTEYVNENGAYYAALANPIYGSATLENCEFSYGNQAGIVITEDAQPMTIVNCKTIGNGKDTTATVVNRSGIRFDVVSANMEHKIINHDARDDANDFVTTGGFSAEEGNLFSDTRTFPATKLDGGHDLRAGQRFVLTNADGGTTDLPVRVEHATGTFDSVDLRPSVASASGTIQNGGNTALTGGSTFAGTINTRRITCTGGALTTEITGKAYVTINGTLYRVAAVVDNNTLDVEELIGATFSGASATLHVSSSTATTALQNYAVYGAQMDIQGMKFTGNASATPTDNLRVGIREVQTINVGATTSAVLTLEQTYPTAPFAVATSQASVPHEVSVVRTSATQLTVHNGAAFSANITVMAEY